MVLLFAIIIIAVCSDQLTKWLAVIFLEGEADVVLWRDVLHFSFVRNKGAAFGMLQNQRWLFMVVSTVAIVGLLIYLIRWKPKSIWVRLSIAMIIGGGIGNMIDRIFLGYVIDFIYFKLIDFPVFNVADSFVTVGCGILVVYLFYDLICEMRREKQAKLAGTAQEEKKDEGSAD
ncbi:MAG: signal peptidase II [Clostridia bacterium]|jgi:signal peptidase II|nr:signal peptidase II [Clostridia bacterium]